MAVSMLPDLGQSRELLVLTEIEAVHILRKYQELWNRAAVGELLDGFTDDVVVEFADLPIICGKAELERVILARLARQKNYRLQKTLRAVKSSVIIGTWVADWIDGKSGQLMKGRGSEFIEMRGDKCARWEATFNAWPADGKRNSVFV